MVFTTIANLKGPKGDKGDQGEKGLPGMNAAPTDAAVAGLVEGTSETRDAVSGLVRELTGPAQYLSWADWDGTGWLVHRNGGAIPWMVPHTAEAIEANLAAGAKIIEADTRWTGGGATAGGPHTGTLWNIHDDTLGSLMDVTSLLRNTSDAVAQSSRFLASKTTGGRYRDGAPLTFAELIDRYASRALIAVEPKNQTLSQDWEKSCVLLQRIFDARPGAADAVLVEMSSASVAQNVPILQTFAPGVRWSTYVTWDDPLMNNLSFAADCVADGIFAITVGDTATQAFVDVFLDAGVKVLGFVSRKHQLPTFASLGITAHRGDNAMYVADAYSRAKQDYWRDGFWGVGEIPAIGHTRPELETSKLRFDTFVNNRQTILLGDMSPLPATFTIDLELEYTTAGSDETGMCSLFLCAADDRSLTGASWPVGTAGYKCGLWVLGGPRVWRVDSGAEVAIASESAPQVTAGSTYYVRIVVTANTITVSRRDGAGALMGTAAVANDATWRGGFAHLMVQAAPGGAVHKVRKITIT